jgi:hypothetical protein
MANVDQLLNEAISAAKEELYDTADADSQYEMFNFMFLDNIAGAFKQESVKAYALSIRDGFEVDISGISEPIAQQTVDIAGEACNFIVFESGQIVCPASASDLRKFGYTPDSTQPNATVKPGEGATLNFS